MIEQYAKFVKMALETKWRGDIAGLTYIETSTLWRQEHNGQRSRNSLFAIMQLMVQGIPTRTLA